MGGKFMNFVSLLVVMAIQLLFHRRGGSAMEQY